MKTKYRIVTDRFAGYECQEWNWYWPFWTQMNGINTHDSIEQARSWLDHRIKERIIQSKPIYVVEYYNPKEQ
jgi:hypothetical protein